MNVLVWMPRSSIYIVKLMVSNCFFHLALFSFTAYAACRFQQDCDMWKIVNKNGKNGFVETNTLPRELTAQDSDSLPSRGKSLN